MNGKDVETNDDRVAGLLADAAEKLSSSSGGSKVVEQALENSTDSFFIVTSPLGELYVGAGACGVRLVHRGGSREEFVRGYRHRFGRLLVESEDAKTRRLAERVARALTGEKVRVPLDLEKSTPFQRRVLGVVGGIPRGEVRPYNWVAREAGSPGASRAVGSVMASNPVPLLIPCHRVVRNDGSTGNYAFGAQEKIQLLEGEGVSTAQISVHPYIATPTTGVVCHATCRNARRIRPENRRPFRSAREAVEEGYRPCEVCRPVVR